jgi:hypothetical protein
MRMNTAKVALAIAGVLSLLSPALAAPPNAPPGQEALGGAMLGANGGLPGGCKLDGATLDGKRVDASFLCGAAPTPVKIRLTPPGMGGLAARHTLKFDVVPEAGVPSELVDALETRIRSLEGDWLWNVDGLPASHPLARAARSAQPPWPRGAAPSLVAVACSWLLTFGLLGWSGRRRAAAPAHSNDGTDRRFSLLVTGVLLVSIAVSVDRFRFVYDDYRFLYRAIESPWIWDEGLRFLTVSCPYWWAHLVAPGATWPFSAVNTTMMLAAITLWVLALRGAGLDADEALLAGALFGIAPGGADLLRRASGIEGLAATAVIVGALFAVQRAARRNDAPPSQVDTITTVTLVLTLAATGTFVKFPYMVVLPPAVWMWARFVAPSSPAFLRSVVFAAAVAAASGIPWVATRSAGVSGGPTIPSDVSLDRVLSNLRTAGIVIAPWLSAVAWTIAFLMVWRLTRAAWTARRKRSRLFAALRGEATRLALATFDTVRQPLGKLPLGILAPALSLLLLAPCLFNFDYFARYYVWPPAAPLAVLAARGLIKAADVRRAPLVVQLVAIALLVPRWDLRPPDPREPTERSRAFLAEVAALATTSDPPDRIILVPSCDSPDENAAAAEDLRTLYAVTGAHYGMRWATGRPVGAAIIEPSAAAVPPAEGDLRLFYCPGLPLRLAPRRAAGADSEAPAAPR